MTPVDAKVISGNLAASKKSGLFRCVSRSGSRVLMLETSMTASTRAEAQIGGIEIHAAADAIEFALHVGDHQVAHFELRSGVLRIDL